MMMMNTKTKTWADSNRCAEEFVWNGHIVLRYKNMITEPWTYPVGEFTKNHCRFSANDRDRVMTQREIQGFKEAKLVRAVA